MDASTYANYVSDLKTLGSLVVTSSALASLGMLKPWTLVFLNCLVTLVSASKYYLGYSNSTEVLPDSVVLDILKYFKIVIMCDSCSV